ncbi:MAG: hypothetical protein ABWK01_03110 [Infirmifilum sp.]
MADDPQNCMLEGCVRPAEIMLEVGGQVLYLCRLHFSQLVSRMERAAERRGSISPRSLKVEKLNDGKVKISIRRSKRSSNSTLD